MKIRGASIAAALWVALAGTHLSALAAPPSEERQERGFRPLQSFSTSEEGAGAQNFAITQDRRGVLYVGNLAGVLEYDGTWWRTIPLRNEAVAMSLVPGPDGRVIVGGLDEIGYLEPDAAGQMQYVSMMPLLPKGITTVGEVYDVHKVSEGFLFTTDAALLQWNGGRETMKLISELEPGPATKASFLIDGTVWVWTPEGLHRVVDGRMQKVDAPDRFEGRRVNLMQSWYDGRILVSVRDEGLFLFDGTRAHPFAGEASRRAARQIVSHGCRLPDGRTAIATRRGGLMILSDDGEIDEIIDSSVGLPDDNISFAHASPDGSLWLVMDTGIARVEASSPLSVIDSRGGLKGTVVAATRHDGILYAGTANGIFTIGAAPRASEANGVNTPLAKPLDGVEGSAFALLSVDDDLIAGAGEGLWRIRGKLRERIEGTEKETVYFLTRSPSDRDLVWVGSREGLGLLERAGQRWTFRRVEGSPPLVRSIVEVNRQTLWLGTTLAGAVRIELPPLEGADPLTAASIHRHGEGEIDVHSISGRIVFTAESRIHRFDEHQQALVLDPILGRLGNQTVLFVLAEDGRGNIWMNTRPPGLALRASDRGYSFDDRLLIGMPGTDVQMIYPEPDGVVWFGNEKGLIRYDTSIVPEAADPPPPLVRRVTLGGELLAFRDGEMPAVATGSRRLRIESAAVSFEPGVVYQYRLDPVEQEWSDWTVEPFTEFTNLWEGDYTFRVRTKALSNNVSPETTWSFEVLPPWYRTAWAYALWALGTLLLLAGISRIRHRSLRHQKAILEARVAEQTHELTHTVEQLRLAKQELEAKNRELEVVNSRLEALSLHDPLTGIPNRRQLEEALKREWNRAWRARTSLAFVLMDIDLFKSLNDTRGHHEGDECLKRIATFLGRSLRRSGDLAARYGGEEFAMILPNTDPEGARHFAEHLRAGIEKLDIVHESSPFRRITASFGVAAIEPHDDLSTDDLFLAADRALYRAKAEGRNCVRVA
ncbi:MAG TPA: diguanylate cyclase [Thermoanaerobaculia bacterium]|nr:diguanylate cyclase [Thermoanaerobaculia bacterium]